MRILLVEDNAQARQTLVEILTDEQYEVCAASGGHEALRLAEREPPDLIVSDVHMPDGDGLELVREARRSPWGQGTPILLMSGEHQVSQRVAGLDVGADDFIAKPVDVEELLARIRSHARRALREVALVRSSLLDPLTGVLNRRGLDESYAREIARSARGNGPLAVALIDLNGFKTINDQHGHLAGDRVLCEVAAALRAALRSTDTLGRIGGDEFVLVFASSNETDERILARRLRALAPVCCPLPGGTEVPVTFAVGVTTSEANEPLEAAMLRADRAMYGHKASLRPPERLQTGSRDH